MYHKVGRSEAGWLNRLINSRLNYWLGFSLDFITIFLFLAWDAVVQRRSLAAVALWALGGFVLWGPSEYALHRWLYHRVPLMRDGHGIHHDAPRALVGMPWFVTTGVITGVWYLLSCYAGITFAASFLAGWYAGFFYYSVVHHGLHHASLDTPWLRKLKVHHAIHHHYEDTNFGVSTRVWDRVFGTMFERETRERREAMAVERT
jgi:sterol desaturase/sphingolipid hydroxylase (fatty acid hydroxylase superfamily)